MTQELIQTGLMNSEFQSNVLKFWSCYLQECKVGFTSKYYEKIPTLCFNYKHRDARVSLKFDYTYLAFISFCFFLTKI